MGVPQFIQLLQYFAITDNAVINSFALLFILMKTNLQNIVGLLGKIYIKSY